MTPSFFIAKSYVTKLDFVVFNSAQQASTPISHLETSLHVDVRTSISESDMYHLVEIHVNIFSATSNNVPVYNLNLTYDAIVGMPEFIADETVLNEILKEQVPQTLLDNIRSIVYQVTREAGFPFMMRDDTFDNPIHIDDSSSIHPKKSIDDFFEMLNKESFVPFKPEKTNFQWLIGFSWVDDDDELLENIQDFWNYYSSQVENGVITDYEDLPIYKCYYRFFTPIDYCHPDFEECEESIWPILFQMLYGSFKSQCQVIDVEQDDPEILFSYEDFQDRAISSLTLEELKELLSDLFTEALTDLSVNLLGYHNENVLSDEQSQSNQLTSELDFYRLLNANVSDENAVFLHNMYEKIKECSLQTLLYQNN